MVKRKETVTLATYSHYDLDGDLELRIADWQEILDEATKEGITDIYITTDCNEEPKYMYGGYDGTTETIWTISIVGKKG